MMKFLNGYSYKQVAYEKPLEVAELTQAKYKAGLCKKTSSNICIVLFIDPSSPRQLIGPVEPLLPYYKNDPVSIVAVDKISESKIH
jgi:hypothetical protein